MTRQKRSIVILLVLGAAWLLAPDLAYADNCSSLNDCYYTLRAALAAAVGLGVFSALMAIGLDVGPFAGNLKKRLDGAGGDEGAADAFAAAGVDSGIDIWNRSLGVVSVSGLVAPPATARSAPAPAASTRAPAKGEGAGMEQAAPRGDRASDQARGDAPHAPGRAAGEESFPTTSPGEAPAGGEDVADRAQDVAEAFEPADGERMTQAHPSPDEPMSQVKRPAPAEPDHMAQADAPPGSEPAPGAGEEGPRAVEPGQRAKSVPDRAPDASDQGRPPAETPAEGPEAPRMRQAPAEGEGGRMEQAAPRGDRAADQARGDAPQEPGRRAGEESLPAASPAEPPAGAAGEDVAGRAQDVAEAFDSGDDARMSQAQPPPDEPMTQAESPASSGPERMAQAEAPQAEPPPHDRPQPPQAAKPAGAEAQTGPEQQAASSQSSAPPEGRQGVTGEAGAAGSPAQGAYAQAASDLARAYGDLSRVPGMRLLLQQVAFHGRWAARAAAAQLTIARRLGRHGAQLSELADRGRGADIVLGDGAVVEVKNYYWWGPFFNNDDNVAAATRRLVRQMELLRRRYPGREVQVAFSDPRHIPRQMRIVLQSIGVDVAPGVEGQSPNPRDVAADALVERLRRMTVEQYMEALADSGLDIDDAALQGRLRAAFVHDPASAWLALAVVAFDAESIYETNPLGESYAAHLQALGLASGGVFSPENIAERIQGQTHHVAFSHGERRYEVRTPVASDYVAHDVLDTVNRALADSGAARQFWTLPSPDQMLYLAFVAEDVVRVAVEAGLVPPPEA